MAKRTALPSTGATSALPIPSVPDPAIAKLFEPREGYAEEIVWHKFLLDAYYGTGGFAGRARAPASGYWGAGASMYAGASLAARDAGASEAEIDTYLDRFTREDMPKFERRVNVAHYDSLVEVVVDVRLSFLAAKPFAYSGIERLRDGDPGGESGYREGANVASAWWENADGWGASWASVMADVVRPRAAVLGWCPVLLDLPAAPEGELSVAQAREAGIVPRVLPLFPANLLRWSCDRRGAFVWASVLTLHEEQPEPDAPTTTVATLSVWYPNRVRVVEIEQTTGDNGSDQARVRRDEVRPHGWGRVPIVIFRPRAAGADRIAGPSPVASIAGKARRLFNLHSELDEHLRSSTFAMLQVPTKNPTRTGRILVGNSNALPIAPDATQKYEWIAPPATVAEVYERRIEATEQAIYRLGRIEFTRAGETKQAQSGISRAFEFESTNRSIADMAAQFARAEQETLRLVARGYGMDEGEVEKLRVVPPSKFDVEEIATEIETTAGALSLGLGRTADAEIKRRIVSKILPNLDAETEEAIGEEIEGLAREKEQAAAAGAAALAAAAKGKPVDEPDDAEEPDDEEDDAEEPDEP